MFEQARSLGLADRWVEVYDIYASVNRLFGDIIKVTPTSKVVGDMALFMVANGLTRDDILNSRKELAFPQSVVDLMTGRMGKPYRGFPKKLREIILRGEKPLTDRPGKTLAPANFSKAIKHLRKIGRKSPQLRDALSWTLYPKVFEDLVKYQLEFDDTSHLPTPVYFYGLKPREEITIDDELGKALIIKFQAVGEPHLDGRRTAFFEVNGQPREVMVDDLSLVSSVQSHKKAETNNPNHIATSMPGMVIRVAVSVGDVVQKGQAVLMLEAMKMESTLYFEKSGKVSEILVSAGTQVENGDLLVLLE